MKLILIVLLFLQDPPENPVVTMCGHVFCYKSISEFLKGSDNICPAVEKNIDISRWAYTIKEADECTMSISTDIALSGYFVKNFMSLGS